MENALRILETKVVIREAHVKRIRGGLFCFDSICTGTDCQEEPLTPQAPTNTRTHTCTTNFQRTHITHLLLTVTVPLFEKAEWEC